MVIALFLQKGIALIILVWRPYFTQKALDELQQLDQPLTVMNQSR
jgi:hypothetical protein